MNTTKLIITADDYGFCNEVDKGILDAAKSGLLNSVAALPNGHFNKERIGFLRDVQENYRNGTITHKDSKVSHLDVGCHLTITSGKAQTKAARENKYLSKDGYFRSYTKMERPESPYAIRELNKLLKDELLAQIDVFKGIVDVAHLSSHHDSLVFFPDYYETLLEIAEEEDIPVRSPVMLPESREQSYFKQIGFRMGVNLKRRERKEYREFRKSRSQRYDNLTKNHTAPDFLFGGNYVLRTLFSGIWEERPQKAAALSKLRKHYPKRNGSDHVGIPIIDDEKPLEMDGKTVEICAHLISPDHGIDFAGSGPSFTKERLGGKDNPYYYPGVATAYFDGREIEYRLLELLKPRIFNDNHLEFTAWKQA